ncbi:putative secreted protein (Por secretion system target) [Lacibacter cauensis]|uniref:Putative secreted protein (Por secretion system target) n=1 Tax=Lacibacter cauensis TaxID=510947 RepID=A0A562SGJ3_9BACT|nr:T9SS type A sorting domain-containing protein [Lacibacter cauensis]TWI80427.1 putative secreted protein (Por secretion system target) [Lacibacter cauensis]
MHIVLLLPLFISAQITTPMVRANFGLDADLRHNFFNGAVLSGNDDWFSNADAGTGVFVIDTTGAAAIYSTYTSNPSSRFASFARGMRYPVLSTVNNRIFYDATFVRDHRATDTTGFPGGLKNGMSPQLWSSVVSPVPSKNDITEVFLHVRRDGPTSADSLFFFGGVGILGTTGDRYFDFELYQTDITYNRSTGTFTKYGPDFGHSTWRFNASGQITQLGDIIFTAEYGTSGLTAIEARIWIEKTALPTVTPQAFSWTGTFDGDGNNATYGYAGIVPKTGGNFYQGLQNSASVWSGPFGNLNSSNLPVTTYDPVQFMEFSVNLSRLGLDPMTFTNGSMCNLAFGKVLVKTRTSTSFTSSLSDFVAPFSFRSVASVDATADFPALCSQQFISNLSVRNPLSTSTYSWSTTNGRIVGSTTGTTITVDQPGTYIVTQELLSGCGENGRDTINIVIAPGGSCAVLNASLLSFTARNREQAVELNWKITNNNYAKTITVERSLNGQHFAAINDIAATANTETADYIFTDAVTNFNSNNIFYRLKITNKNGQVTYSEIQSVKINYALLLQASVNPNPVAGNRMTVQLSVPQTDIAVFQLIHSSGAIIHTHKQTVTKGSNSILINGTSSWQPGLYVLRITVDGKTLQQKVIVTAG